MIPRPDLLSERSPKGLEVFQLTTEREVPSCHIYMEAQVFTPDSTRLIVHRSARAHGSDQHDPEHRYLVCDLENNGELIPITHETGSTAPSVSPDSQWLYYFVNETEVGGGRLTLKRVRLDGSERSTIAVLDAPIPGTPYRISRIYPLSTISSDGTRIATCGFLGDGQSAGAPWGLIVFHIQGASVRLVLSGPSWCNIHPQYCRSSEPEHSRDILVQENHGNLTDAQGKCTRSVSGLEADIHVIRDDGTNSRDMPWGRDGNEFCQGHQCWIGRTERAITSTGTMDVDECQLIEGLAAPPAGHVGIHTPAGQRNDLSRAFPKPQFCHFATDIAGKRLISDSRPREAGGGVYLADLPQDGISPLQNITFLLCPRNSWTKDNHVHPFLSPDGSTGFFNSDESGLLQAYMVRGW